MPIYEYQCKNCGTRTEFLIGIGDENESLICKNCGGSELIKLISPAAPLTISTHPKGKTCCGREERCEKPTCSGDEVCRKE